MRLYDFGHNHNLFILKSKLLLNSAHEQPMQQRVSYTSSQISIFFNPLQKEFYFSVIHEVKSMIVSICQPTHKRSAYMKSFS